VQGFKLCFAGFEFNFLLIKNRVCFLVKMCVEGTSQKHEILGFPGVCQIGIAV
jgi:hypothetical protein